MAFVEDQHPRGSGAQGGEFVAKGSGSSSSGKTSKGRSASSGGKSTSGSATLSYNPRTGRGTGYGVKGGDARVRALQAALNRLGLTDAAGKKLAVDGQLGPKSTAAVKAAQRRLGLPADGKVTPELLTKLKRLKKLPAAPARAKQSEEVDDMGDRTTDAVIDGVRAFDDIRELVRDALADRHRETSGVLYAWAYVADLTDTQVVYTVGGSDELMQCSYAIGDDDEVTLGSPTRVVRTYTAAPASGSGTAVLADTDAEEAEEVDTSDRQSGRVMEAKGTDEVGGRVFRVRILKYGTSKNGRRYTESVMREAASLYEGAKAYDHHRTAAELESSTINGLVGHYRQVEATTDGLYGDLHLLPSATHAAESLDAAIASQAAGLDPIVGISHDVRASFRTVVEGGTRLQEAVQIVSVDSADIVAKPSAGGLPMRAVAGGEPNTNEGDDVPTKADFLAALKEATDDELAAVGFARTPKVTESTATPPTRVTEGEPNRTTEAAHPKDSFVGRLMITEKVKAAGLPEAVAEAAAAQLPDQIRESDVDGVIAGLKSVAAVFERGGLAPNSSVQVTKEAQDKKTQALDDFFASNGKGYTSFRHAIEDISGRRQSQLGEDHNRALMRECVGSGAYDSGVRATESLTAASFAQVLGDSVTRRMVADYNQPSLQTWRLIVSSTPSLPDFRTQRVGRIGGYGVLPTVGEGAPYQPLTSPPDEEATYALAKRGGTEDITLEMIANDDVRAIQKIPTKLGLAAAQTLYRFVWDILPTNAATTYDSTALFHTDHANNDNPAVLGQSTLSVGRRKMRQQASYGDTSNILSIVPKYLIVPSALEEIAYQLCTSAVAIPSTPAGPSNTPNIHQGLQPIVVDYYSDANDWYLGADPTMCPTIEVGFYQGRQEPELFTQSDPNAGSAFNSDTITYKLRHIYSGAVLDHRGFYRGNN
jgi:hypothetical protein